jgi:hypothetical protein
MLLLLEAWPRQTVRLVPRVGGMRNHCAVKRANTTNSFWV